MTKSLENNQVLGILFIFAALLIRILRDDNSKKKRT